ncbi:CD209 antigen-like protein A [Diadema setosum]|uniref:CD209 antigen-like protein A n=1 Tax=Diadema setosum TaxID=31175 RepID=UPI003B3B72B9
MARPSCCLFVVALLVCVNSTISQTEVSNEDRDHALYTLAETCPYDACPANWPPRAAGRDACYIYCGDQKEWTAARDACGEIGGKLVKFESDAEVATVRNFVMSTYKLDQFGSVWTGLNDRSNEGTYVWDGFGGSLSTSSSLWGAGHPDNVYNFWYRSDEDCVELRGRKLNDLYCADELPFVCEYHPLD